MIQYLYMAKKSLETGDYPFTSKLFAAYPASELFVVGGAVRDHLLERAIKDYDLVARGISIEDLMKFLRSHGEVNLVGKRFGVLKFKPAGQDRVFDIALPRREYSRSFTGGYRDFDIQSDPTMPIEEDLARRDFTINAMAYNLRTGEIVDPFLGQKDLKARQIRTVGAAVTRFQEDYSRMLRAVRFACQLNFNISDRATAAIKKMGHHIDDRIDDHWVVAREVISQEFLKGFDANPVRCLELSDELGLLELLFPEIKELQHCEQSPPFHLEGNAWQHLLLALNSTQTDLYKQHFPQPLPLLSKLGILFHDVGKPKAQSMKDGIIHFYGHEQIGAKMTADICRRLKLDSSESHRVACDDLVWLVREHLFSIKSQSKKVSAVVLEDMFFSRRPGKNLLQVILADLMASVTKERHPLEPFEKLIKEIRVLAPNGALPPPLISGSDVIEWCDVKPGPQIAKILRDTREQQLTGLLSDRANARAYIEQTYGTSRNPRPSRGKK